MLSESTTHRPGILFVNYKEQQCGVYQYGKNVFDALNQSQKYSFRYVEVSSLEDLDAAVSESKSQAIIYNYHPQTLSFINPNMTRRYPPVNIAIMHEMTQAEADAMPNGFFQYYVMGDPTLMENNPAVFKTGRLIIRYTNRNEAPDVVTIGTFGFSVGSKGYQRVIDAVQDEFDEAIIRIHIPANGIIDEDGAAARQHIEECQKRIKKPGVRIVASHDFLDRQAMLDFLAGNTVNVFLYDYLEVAGISSSPDHALAVRRPIAITRSIMFRHLWSLYPPITVEDTSLREIIRNGIKPFAHLYELWTAENLRLEYEEILDKVLDPKQAIEFQAKETVNQSSKLNEIPDFDYQAITRKYKSKRAFLRRGKDKMKSAIAKQVLKRAPEKMGARGIKRFNRILDNQSREQYKSVIRQLNLLAPEIMVSKIPSANIQQAFVFDTVKRFMPPTDSPRLLCVGSYDDSASASLKKLGYAVEEIDPEVNGLDLNGFFQLPSTIKGSYDIVFSTSVIEHVEDDELFVEQIEELLTPGGIGVLTCDFNDLHKPGDPVIPGDYRFYTQRDLVCRLLPRIKNCSLVDVPHWECADPDFMFVGYRYTFATLVFRKNDVR